MRNGIIKKIIMVLPVVLMLIIMILSLTCPISYSYHVSYARIDGVGSRSSKTDYAEYYFRDDLGISSGGAIAIVVIFCTLAIAGIVFLYKAKDLDRRIYLGTIIATIVCAMVPFFMTIACSAINKSTGSTASGGSKDALYYGSNVKGLKGAGVAIIILSILAIIVFVVGIIKKQKEMGLSQKQIEKAKAEVTEDNWLS